MIGTVWSTVDAYTLCMVYEQDSVGKANEDKLYTYYCLYAMQHITLMLLESI